jgi:hypothetical protein
MKNKVFRSFLLLTNLLLLIPLINAQDLPEILAIRELKLRPGVNETAFQNYYNIWCKNIKDHTKGVNAWIMKGDRGSRSNKYDMMWGFNYLETRDYYFPVSDITNYPKWNAALGRFQFQAPQDPFVEDINAYTDFLVVGYDNMINPQLGEVLSISFPEVKAGKEKELEDFVTDEMNNAFQDNIDGYYIYLLKGDRGALKGKYAVMRVFSKYEKRQLFFPENSETPSPEFGKATKKTASLTAKFKTYFETSPFGDCNDFVIYY